MTYELIMYYPAEIRRFEKEITEIMNNRNPTDKTRGKQPNEASKATTSKSQK